MIGKATQISNLSRRGKDGLGHLPGTNSEQMDNFFKPADIELHDAEVKLFRSLQQKIAKGLKLSPEEEHQRIHGLYYRHQSPAKFLLPEARAFLNTQGKATEITHVSHASEVISLQGKVPLQINIDPVHYQSGTDGIIGPLAKLAYDRQTDPAFSTHQYPAINIVLISHNHHDHMCRSSLEEGFKGNPGTIFIVPVGDKRHMKRFGLKNIIEFESWDDYADINMKDEAGNQATYRISAFPAKHASNRSLQDYYRSLYMGYLMQNTATNHVVLCTGDTAVLDEQHFQELEQYLLKNDLTISAAAIAHGPDRPRSKMLITHQSTADAVAMHARFNIMNLKVIEARKAKVTADSASGNNKELSAVNFTDLCQAASHGIGYHQGCYRLGLLSLNDVPSTLLRMLTVLDSLKNIPINQLVSPQGRILENFSKNLHFNFLDDFEKQGLADTLKNYQQSGIKTLTAGQVKALICSNLHIPQPGSRTDLAQEKPNEGFKFDYQRLIVNRDPKFKGKGFSSKPYEYFASKIPFKSYNNIDTMSIQEFKEFIQTSFKAYVGRRSALMRFFTGGRQRAKEVQIFLQRVEEASKYKDDATGYTQSYVDKYKAWFKEQVKEEIRMLYNRNYKAKDEGIRTEGHLHTLITIMSGLIDNIGDFRTQFGERQELCHPDAKKPLPCLVGKNLS